jgi:hypothetical protein
MKIYKHDVPFNDCCEIIDRILDIFMTGDYDEIVCDEIAELLVECNRLDREL